MCAALVLALGCGRLGFNPVRGASGSAGKGVAFAADGGASTSPQHVLDAGAFDAGPATRSALDAGATDVGTGSGNPLPRPMRDAGPARDLRDAAMPEMRDANMPQPPALDAALPKDGSGPAPGCPEYPGALFCDGFEDPKLMRWSYSVLMNGTAMRTTARKRSGMAALHATTGAAAQDNAARYATKALDQQTSGDAWLRFYDYLPSSTVITTSFSAGVMSELEEPYHGFFLIVLPTRVDIGSFGGYFTGTAAFPRDRWVCVELHVMIDPADGAFEAFLDSALVARATKLNTLPDHGYTAAEVGIHYADKDQGPVEIYVDDVVVSRSRIGCN
jgi:hypothetical protein